MTLKRCFPMLLLICANLASAQSSKPVSETLSNGLKVSYRPVAGAKNVALIVLYDIGETHDPKGASGMAHLIEHLYVTAAAGDVEARSTQEYMKAYPDGWNAQTGRDHTVIATVFPPERMDSELSDAAARMTGVKVTQEDLDREIPRIDQELGNMFGRIPQIGVRNLAIERVQPLVSGRKGGVVKEVKAIPLSLITKRLTDFYKPANARLVFAGAIDAKKLSPLVKAAFSNVLKGKSIPKPPATPKSAKQREVDISVAPLSPSVDHVAIAYRLPQPGSKLYAPTLVQVGRLQRLAAKLQPPPGQYPVQYSVSENPGVFSIALAVSRDSDPDATLDKIREFVQSTVKAPYSRDDRTMTQQQFAFSLGLAPIPDQMLAQNLYGVGYSLARRLQSGVDSAKLRKAVGAVRKRELEEVATVVFGKGKEAKAIVRVKKG